MWRERDREQETRSSGQNPKQHTISISLSLSLSLFLSLSFSLYLSIYSYLYMGGCQICSHWQQPGAPFIEAQLVYILGEMSIGGASSTPNKVGCI